MADEKAASGPAGWLETMRSENDDVTNVQVEAAGAEAEAAVEHERMKAMRKKDKAEEELAAELARKRAAQTVAGITSGEIPSPRGQHAHPASAEASKLRSKDELEAAKQERSTLEKVAKDMADMAATRKQERRSSANPRELHDYAGTT